MRLFFSGWFCLLSGMGTACSQTAVPVVFVASTPCSEGTRPLPGIPREAACELMKWKLQLYGRDSGRYVLDCDYGLPLQGTPGLVNGGTHLHREGRWGILKTDGRVYYLLDPDMPSVCVSFLRLNNDLLHLLDSHRQLMIGNGAWSYTLNRLGP